MENLGVQEGKVKRISVTQNLLLESFSSLFFGRRLHSGRENLSPQITDRELRQLLKMTVARLQRECREIGNRNEKAEKNNELKSFVSGCCLHYFLAPDRVRPNKN